jgi:hypothetical protein
LQDEARNLGVDPHAPLAHEDDDESAGLVVPQTVCTLSEDQLQHFHQQIELIENNSQHGVFDDVVYINGLQILGDFLQG